MKETAKDILTRHSKAANNDKEFDYSESCISAAMREIADTAYIEGYSDGYEHGRPTRDLFRNILGA